MTGEQKPRRRRVCRAHGVALLALLWGAGCVHPAATGLEPQGFSSSYQRYVLERRKSIAEANAQAQAAAAAEAQRNMTQPPSGISRWPLLGL